MKVELENDYIGLNSTDFVTNCEMAISENGVWVWLDIHDCEEPEEDFSCHASIGWQSLMKEALKCLVDDCTDGYGILDLADLAEDRDEWIAQLENFIERLRMLPQVEDAPQ